MKTNNAVKKPFYIEGYIVGIITANILGILTWLLPMLCKDWLLSISLEDFYAKYTVAFISCSTLPLVQSIILLCNTNRKKAISISRGIKADIWMILIVNIFAFLSITISHAVIDSNSEILSERRYQRWGEFIIHYGEIYVAAMLVSMLFGITVMRRNKKGERKVIDAE